MRLLRADELIVTGTVDHAEWNYRPGLGFVSRQRFGLVAKLVAGERANRTLEIGYGSGVFMPELSQLTGELYGVDVHGLAPEVEAILRRRGISANLVSGSIESAPFADAFFDRVVAVSALEFVPDLEGACAQIERVLTNDGRFIVVAPRASPLLDAVLKLATGQSAKCDFANRREKLRPALERHFIVERRLTFPPAPLPSIYEGLRLRKAG